MAPIQLRFWGKLSLLSYISSKSGRYYTCIDSMCPRAPCISSFKIVCLARNRSPPPIIGWTHKQGNANQILLRVSYSFKRGFSFFKQVLSVTVLCLWLLLGSRPVDTVAACWASQSPVRVDSILIAPPELCLLPHQAQHFPTAGYLAAQQKEHRPIGTDFLKLLMTKL